MQTISPRHKSHSGPSGRATDLGEAALRAIEDAEVAEDLDADPQGRADDFWGPPIAVYTRQQALDDGVLVDVSAWAGSGPDGMMGGFRVAVVMTRALWDVVDSDGDDFAPWRQQARKNGESTRGRAHDVLWMTRIAAGQHPHADRVHVSVLMTGEGKQGRLVRRTLRLLAAIDGDGITIGFPADF